MDKVREVQLPIIVERDDDGFYTVECPLFQGCFTQGKTLDEALENIQEVIGLVLKEPENKDLLSHYEEPKEIGLRTIRTSVHV